METQITVEMEPEVFTPDQVETCLRHWLKYGEQSFVPEKEFGAPGHRGVFSGDGFEARCLRYHLSQVKNANDASRRKPDRALEKGIAHSISVGCEDWAFVIDDNQTRIIDDDGYNCMTLNFEVASRQEVRAAIYGYGAGMKAGLEAGQRQKQEEIRRVLGL